MTNLPIELNLPKPYCITLSILGIMSPLCSDCWEPRNSLRPNSCPKVFPDNLRKNRIFIFLKSANNFFQACYMWLYFWTTNSLRVLVTYMILYFKWYPELSLTISKYFFHEHQGKSWKITQQAKHFMSRLKQGTCTIPVLEMFLEPSMIIIIIAIDPLWFINSFQMSSH